MTLLLFQWFSWWGAAVGADSVSNMRLAGRWGPHASRHPQVKAQSCYHLRPAPPRTLGHCSACSLRRRGLSRRVRWRGGGGLCTDRLFSQPEMRSKQGYKKKRLNTCLVRCGLPAEMLNHK